MADLKSRDRALRTRVRHSTTDFAILDGLYPGLYPRVIVRGKGAYLIDSRGQKLLDSGAHLGACMIGHGRKEIASALARQIETIEWTSLDSGLSNPVAIELAER